MANKRQLTGGTDDVNPQYLSGAITLTAANVVTRQTIGTPIVRVGSDNSGSATIMEVLKIWCDMPPPDDAVAAATFRGAVISWMTSEAPSTSFVPFDNPRVLASLRLSQANAFTAAGTGLLEATTNPMMVDLTDGAGHGVLVATDNLYIQADTQTYTGVATFRYKILYRFKKVKLVEYIGIVQSQQ